MRSRVEEVGLRKRTEDCIHHAENLIKVCVYPLYFLPYSAEGLSEDLEVGPQALERRGVLVSCSSWALSRGLHTAQCITLSCLPPSSPYPLPIDIFPVGNAEQLDHCRVEKAKHHVPVPRDAERKKTCQETGQTFCVEHRVEWIPLEERQEREKLALLCRGEFIRRLQEVRVVL